MDWTKIAGTQAALAELLGVGESAVSNWRRHGLPDARKWQIMLLARDRGIEIEIDDLEIDPTPQPDQSQPAQEAA